MLIGDGIDDIIIGAPYAPYQAKAGITYIIFGQKNNVNMDINELSTSNAKGFSIKGMNPGYNLLSGHSVSNAGDMNNDGYDDVIIGSDGHRAYIIFGKSTGFINIDLANTDLYATGLGFSIIGDGADGTGGQVSGAGDVNGDGYDDVIIGAVFTSNAAGAAYIIFGKQNGFSNINIASLTLAQGIRINGINPEDRLGRSVSNGGDIDRDGYDDVVIGAYGASSTKGVCYVIYGRSSFVSYTINVAILSSNSGFTITGASVGDRIGVSVSGAGDINGDGYDDIAIGAENAYSNAGATYIIYGKQRGSNNIDLSNGLKVNQGFTIIGNSASNQQGLIVSVTGDINKDGYSDIIIGEPFADASCIGDPASCIGASYIIFGNGEFTPTATPTVSPTPIPTFVPTLLPTANPSAAPTALPTAIPTVMPTVSPTVLPTHTPSEVPTATPTMTPTFMLTQAPSQVPTLVPTVSPSYMPTIPPTVAPTSPIKSIREGGTYTGSSASEVWDLDSDDDVYINTYASMGGEDTFTIYSHSNVVYTISYFDLSKDKIDLYHFPQFHSKEDLNITVGSAIINLSNNQKIRLENLTPSQVYTSAADNFVFAATIAPTVNPTIIPSSLDVTSNDDSTPAMEEWWFKAAVSVGSTIIGAITAWCLREKIAFSIIDNWGFKYKLIYKGDPGHLESYEMGFLITDNNKLSYKFDSTIRNIPIGNENDGISQKLYDIVLRELNVPSQQERFKFYPKELVEIRTFLLSHHKLDENYQKLGCGGYIYKTCLNTYKIQYNTKRSEDIRPASSSMSSNLDPENFNVPEDNEPGIQMKTHGLNGSNGYNKAQQNDNSDTSEYEYFDEESSSIPKSPDTRFPTKAIAIKKYQDPEALVCIDASIFDPSYTIPFENIANAITDGTFFTVVQKIVADITNALPFKTLTTGSSLEENNAIVSLSSQQFPGTAEFSSSYSITSLLNIRQAIEYIPIVKYAGQNIVYPLVENYLPESTKNISLPEVLSSKTFIFTAHFATGSLISMLLPAEIIGQSLVISTAGSISFGTSLAASHYLSEHKQEIATQDKPVDITQAIKHCTVTIAAYTAPALATCVLSQAVMPGYTCRDLDLTTKLKFAGSECYVIYKATLAQTTPTTTDTVIPYITDTITAVLVYANGYSSMAIVSNVVTADYMSKFAMDMIPQEVKETYIDPLLNYVSETYEHCATKVNEFIGVAYSYFYA